MKLRKLLSVVLTVFILIGLVSCAKKQVTVTFVYGKELANKTEAVKAGSKISKPQDPVVEGFEFDGWYKDEKCSDGENWKFDSDTVDADITLYAKWTEKAQESNNLKVTFVFGKGAENKVETVKPGEKLSKPEDPTADGYDFGGWYKDEECSDDKAWNFSSDTVSADVTLYAKWIKDPTLGYETITVAKALEIINSLEAGKTTEERYYIRGTVKITDNAYGKMDITDETGTLMIYGSYSADGETKWSAMTDKPSNGDTVLVYGNLQNYKGNTPEVYSGWIVAYKPASKPSVELPLEGSDISIEEAIKIAESLSSGDMAPGRYNLRGKIVAITNPNYGEMTITDGTNEIYIYGSYSADGSVGYAQMTDKPYKGDEVYISALIQNYNGKPELKSVWIKEFKSAMSDVKEEDYKSMTVAEARDAKEDDLIKVSGVVAQITYANGKIPSGFILVDSTSSIYVYDSQVAPRVSVGNTVTILAQKTWWILDTEAANAAKFGYKGCCQLENATLKSNDGKVSDFNKTWINEITVKDIMTTPVTEDITSKIFKVNALVKKSVGDGFVNYYFDDLDGKTGSYAYSQCNGSDYDWISAFDGKICTVYLIPLNAKSTSTGCNWRFLPVKIIDEGFKFNQADAAKFAVEYFALDQFESKYAADPNKELIQKVDSELLGFNGVTLAYTSSNTDVAYIENGVLHVKDSGKATITVTASYSTYAPYSTTVEITVTNPSAYNAITVDEAIKTAVNTEITVKGVVGPSLVNQQGGFYLIDDTGVIAVKFNVSADISNISIGDEIIIKGKRDAYSAKDGYPGQVCITGAVLEVNLYGENKYSTNSFDTTKDFAHVYSLINSAQETDHTTEVFVIEAKVTCVATAYSTNYYLVNSNDESQKITLYSSSGAQYAWLEQFVGKTVKVEVALCNWNAKSLYKGAILAVYAEDGTKIVNSLNFNK